MYIYNTYTHNAPDIVERGQNSSNGCIYILFIYLFFLYMQVPITGLSGTSSPMQVRNISHTTSVRTKSLSQVPLGKTFIVSHALVQ